MRKLSIIAAAIAICFGLQGQAYGQTGDTTEVSVGKKKITITADSEGSNKQVVISTDPSALKEAPRPSNETPDEESTPNVHVQALGVDLGFNLLMHDNSLNLPSELSLMETKTLNSSHVGLHLVPTTVNLIKHKVNLITAIDFDFNDYAFANNVTMMPRMDTVSLVLDTMVSYKKSKLKTAHLQVPLMLNFQTNPHNERKNFHITVGGYAGILLGAKTKQKSDQLGKVKISDDFNLEKFRYGVTARIGFRNVQFYANYNLSSMFREDQGPEIIPLSLGISLTGALHSID